MDKETAQQVLEAISTSDYDTLNLLNIRVYGNKGRMWSTTACISSLDDVKGHCNPRLAHNYCTVEDIGCPDCLDKLKELAAGAGWEPAEGIGEGF